MQNLSFEPLQPGDEGIEMINGVIAEHVVAVGGFVDAGDDGGHLFLGEAVVGSDRLLVVLERDSEELVLELDGVGEMAELGGRWECGGGGWAWAWGSGGAVGEGIHLHWRIIG